MSTELRRGPIGATLPVQRGVIKTRAVETAKGWVGQVLVDGEITVEGTPTELHTDAVRGIQEFVTERVKAFFTVPLLTSDVEAHS